MLHLSTKVVVIGSNVKRRSGPRVGSIGFISYLSNKSNSVYTDTHRVFGNNDVFNSQIMFTRYGYERKSRFERKNLLLLLPIININNNPVKSVNSTINLLRKSEHTQPLLIISPVANQLTTSITELYAKIYCKLHSSSFLNLIHTYIYDDEKNEEAFKVFSHFPAYIKNFILAWLPLCGSKAGYDLILNTFYGNPEGVKTLFTFINTCSMLEKRFNKLKKPTHVKKRKNVLFKYIKSVPVPQKRNDSLINNLFKPHEFKKITKIGAFNEQYINSLKRLNKAIKNKGTVVVNKHK